MEKTYFKTQRYEDWNILFSIKKESVSLSFTNEPYVTIFYLLVLFLQILNQN